ncbi:MAG: tRNA threonylcarbamoyladenosine dehydratase [Treponema sp.]|jgi:tRNA A37 threonylcarbamoyladenosine dehydratase|nr:tRNA threonylcarbamoyladenosine dehydratase [Treponema sp.]
MPVKPAFQRLSLLAGNDAVNALGDTGVCVFGLGGVGSWTAEALVRSGVGRISIVDSDTVCVTNINRQVQALSGTVGQPKAAALKKRLLEINGDCQVHAFEKVFSKENAGLFELEKTDYIIDAIDSLGFKLDLIETAAARGITLYSSMGMAQKLDPTRLKTASIWETGGCPLARLVRAGLRKRGYRGDFTAVYSDERLPLSAGAESFCGKKNCLCQAAPGAVEWCSSKKVINGSAVTVTATAGMILAALVIQDLYAKFT